MDHQISLLLFISLLILFGLLAGLLGSRVGLPRIATYVLAGALFSPDLLGQFIPLAEKDWARPLTSIALGIIAFIIGGSITTAQLKRMGKSILGAALGESLGAVALVFAGIMFLVPEIPGTSQFFLALAFASMAATTAPAGTIAILHQYRAKGPMSMTLLGVVALDDALGIVFFSIALALISGGPIEENIKVAFEDIGTALVLGSLAGWLLAKIAKHVRQSSMMLPLSLGFILFVVGLSETLGSSPLLSTMALGFTARHVLQSSGDRVFGPIEYFEETVFLLFFTMAGTHFHPAVFLTNLSLISVYFFARVAGKMTGSAFGAKITGAPDAVVKWLGLALIPQAGVAVGLALTLSHQPEFKEISMVIMNVILATTMLYEVIGPLTARFALQQAGEITSTSKEVGQ